VSVRKTLWIILATATYSVSALAAQPLWSGDFETGDLSQWSPKLDLQEGATDRLSVVGEPVREGRHALRATVKHGDLNNNGSRAEVVLRDPMFREGDERWFHWHTMFPADFEPSPKWALYTQWHASGFGVPVGFNVHGETLSFRVMGHEYDGAGKWDAGTLWKEQLRRGKWNEYLLHVKFSDNPNIGFVELWVDGELVVPKTMHATLDPGDYAYLKMGLYRDKSINWDQSIYHDGMRVYAVDPRTRGDAKQVKSSLDVSDYDSEAAGGCGGSDEFASAALFLPAPFLVRLLRRGVRRRRRIGHD
jgi:hypothetical protein